MDETPEDELSDSHDPYIWGEKDDFTEIQLESNNTIFESVPNEAESNTTSAAVIA
jgi:hypothetical protein